MASSAAPFVGPRQANGAGKDWTRTPSRWTMAFGAIGMKKLGDMGANPTIQIDVVVLDEVRLEAMIAEAPASTPTLGRSLPPPLPPSALESRQPPATSVAEAPRRSNLVLVLALVACLAVSFGVVALLRMRSAAAPTPAPNPTTSPSVITVPTVDMNDETPAAR